MEKTDHTNQPVEDPQDGLAWPPNEHGFRWPLNTTENESDETVDSLPSKEDQILMLLKKVDQKLDRLADKFEPPEIHFL